MSGDIRFFNEFLFLMQKKHDDLYRIGLEKFHNIKHSNGTIQHPTLTNTFISNLKIKYSNFSNYRSENVYSNGIKQINRIALLGHPFGFRSIRKRITELGYECVSIHLPGLNPGNDKVFKIPFLKRFIMFSVFANIFFLLARFFPSNISIYYDKKQNNELGKKISYHSCDIALHRLYSIIRRPVIDAFKIGILNDHPGLLPYFRGMSTIEYSILYGFPIAGTVHIIDSGIDTGPILNVSTYELEAGDTIKRVVDRVIMDKENRIFSAIEMIANGNYKTIQNNSDEGLLYYRIHPALRLYVNYLCKTGVART